MYDNVYGYTWGHACGYVYGYTYGHTDDCMSTVMFVMPLMIAMPF